MTNALLTLVPRTDGSPEDRIQRWRQGLELWNATPSLEQDGTVGFLIDVAAFEAARSNAVGIFNINLYRALRARDSRAEAAQMLKAAETALTGRSGSTPVTARMLNNLGVVYYYRARDAKEAKRWEEAWAELKAERELYDQSQRHEMSPVLRSTVFNNIADSHNAEANWRLDEDPNSAVAAGRVADAERFIASSLRQQSRPAVVWITKCEIACTRLRLEEKAIASWTAGAKEQRLTELLAWFRNGVEQGYFQFEDSGERVFENFPYLSWLRLLDPNYQERFRRAIDLSAR